LLHQEHWSDWGSGSLFSKELPDLSRWRDFRWGKRNLFQWSAQNFSTWISALGFQHRDFSTEISGLGVHLRSTVARLFSRS
jgi:hypothetical protein